MLGSSVRTFGSTLLWILQVIKVTQNRGAGEQNAMYVCVVLLVGQVIVLMICFAE